MTAAQEFAARLSAIQADDVARRNTGGPWRLYLPLPGSRTAKRLSASYPTREAAEAALAPMFPAVRERAEIRYEA